MKFRKLLMLTSAAGLATAAAAGSVASAQESDAHMVATAMDGEWVHLTGEVTFTSDEDIGLDYGDGFIIVELDDQDAFREASQIEEGDRVTVRGRVDDDFFELKTVEADTVFVHDRGVLYQTSYADDEPDFAVVSYAYAHPLAHADGATISASGTIEAIDGEEFTLSTMGLDLLVDTEEIEYSPFRSGLGGLNDPQRVVLEVGDRVRVTGVLDTGLFEQSELEATSLVMLEDASSSRESG